MAVQILPPGESSWGNVFKGLGTGISEGINKFSQERQTAKGLQALGIPQEQATQLSGLSPKLLPYAIKALASPNRELQKLQIQISKERPVLLKMRDLVAGGKTQSSWLGGGKDDSDTYNALVQQLATTNPAYKSLIKGMPSNMSQQGKLAIIDGLLQQQQDVFSFMGGSSNMLNMQQPGVQTPNGEQQQTGYPLGQAPVQEEEGLLAGTLKGLIPSLARVAGSVGSSAGLSGDIGSIGGEDQLDKYIAPIREKVTKPVRDVLDKVGLGGMADKIGKAVRMLAPAGLPQMAVGGAPTSKELKDTFVTPAVKAVFGEKYTKPQNSIDASVEELAADAAFLMMPGLAPMKWQKALKVAGLGNTAKFLAQRVGIGPVGQEVAKVGGMFGANIVNVLKPGAYLNRAEELYKTAKDAIKRKPTIALDRIKPITDTARELSSDGYLPKELERAVANLKASSSPGTLLEGATDALRKTKTAQAINRTPIGKIIDLKRHINDLMFNRNASPFQVEQLGRLKDVTSKLIKEYSRGNKNFAKPFYQAENLFASAKGAEKISNYFSGARSMGALLQKGSGKLGAGAAMLLGLASQSALGLKSFKSLAALTTASALPLYAVGFLKHMAKDPTARSIMSQLVKAGMQEKANVSIVLANKLAKHLAKFNKE